MCRRWPVIKWLNNLTIRDNIYLQISQVFSNPHIPKLQWEERNSYPLIIMRDQPPLLQTHKNLCTMAITQEVVAAASQGKNRGAVKQKELSMTLIKLSIIRIDSKI